MAVNKLELSINNGAHKNLLNLIGKWKGLTQTWFLPNELADESLSNLEIKAILDNRFIALDYNGEMKAKPLEGKMIVGFDLPYNQYTINWIDTFHLNSQTMLSTGNETPTGFSVLGSYGSPEYDANWGWRTEFEFINQNEFALRMFNITPEGEEAKASETYYKRFL